MCKNAPEHGHCPVTGCPLNDPMGGRVYPESSALAMMPSLACSDVTRSYDTAPTLSVPTILSRLTRILSVANQSLPPGKTAAMLNGDADTYVIAALGCLIGTMRRYQNSSRACLVECTRVASNVEHVTLPDPQYLLPSSPNNLA